MSDERKECKDCIQWTPRADIGYCKETHMENVDSDDYCGLYEKAIQQKENLMSIEESLALVVSILEDCEPTQQKPEIDDMKKYVEEKARELHDVYWPSLKSCEGKCEAIKLFKATITQIVKDVKGRKKSEVAEWISGDKYW